MVTRALYILVASVLCCCHALRGADTMQGCLDERVRTLQVLDARSGMPAELPLVALGGPEGTLSVEFDILSDDREYLRYSLQHCDASWQPSRLSASEYVDGFNEGIVEDYDYSEATTVAYTHYRVPFPAPDMMPKLSGNYLLSIYPEGEPDRVLAQVRLMVSEQVAGVSAELTGRTDVDYNEAHQQLALEVDVERAEVGDPFNELIVNIQQNGRLDNEVALRHPLRASRTRAVYEHVPQLIFEAGNEYRRFETVNVNYPTMGVEEIGWHVPYYHFTLATDALRAEGRYAYDQTQSGRFLTRVQSAPAGEEAVQADYGVVHFTLDMPEMPGAMVFIDGDLTDRRFDSNSRMLYNEATGLYERSLLLKQGHYNYQYLVVPPGGRRGYTGPVEGDYYPTRNEYTVKVYHRAPGARYDRLIAVALIR
ncbi:MAG: DUF5103 domain-containing protein [Muribaculaceae bacterium]|nr:DUF5103 domain-containing protein [Muribaculaceae bacterium]